MTDIMNHGIELVAPTDDISTMALLKGEGPFQEARKLFSSHSARIEQSQQQRRPSSPIEVRRMEFEAVVAIAKALGVLKDAG